MKCKDCKHFLGGGDWSLCCDIKCGLCYADTPPCKDFEPKNAPAAVESEQGADLESQIQDTAKARKSQGGEK